MYEPDSMEIVRLRVLARQYLTDEDVPVTHGFSIQEKDGSPITGFVPDDPYLPIHHLTAIQ